MKVYTKLVIDIETGKTIEEESFEYDGPIAECKGGGGGHTTTVEKSDPWKGIQPSLYHIYNWAWDLARKPIPYYPRQQIADFTEPQKQYFNIATQWGLKGSPDYNIGKAVLESAYPVSISGYNDIYSLARPIAAGEMTNPETNPGLKSMMDYALGKAYGNINAAASKYGAFGGSSYQDWVKDATARIVANIYEPEAQRQLAAQSLLGKLTTETSNQLTKEALAQLGYESARLGELGLLNQVGSELRDYEQQLLNLEKEKFYYPYTEPWERLKEYATVIQSSNPGGGISTITKPSYSPGLGSSLLSGVSTGVGMAGTLGLIGAGHFSPWALPVILGSSLLGMF